YRLLSMKRKNAHPVSEKSGSIRALTGCQGAKAQKKANNLEKSMTSYEVALRWAMHRDAYSYHVRPDGSKPEADLEILKDISVTGIDVLEKLVDEDQTEASVKMVVKYYFKDQGTVKNLEMEALWWYSEENKQWYIKSDFPVF
ncbi:MAG: hypothetical protein AAF410_06495, partial [Pseudomonadota bacterium]